MPASDNEEKRSFVNVDILDTYAVERWEVGSDLTTDISLASGLFVYRQSCIIWFLPELDRPRQDRLKVCFSSSRGVDSCMDLGL